MPVVELTPGMGPQDWLLVKRMRFAMAEDPMTDNEWLRDLRPALGDSVSPSMAKNSPGRRSPTKSAVPVKMVMVALPWMVV